MLPDPVHDRDCQVALDHAELSLRGGSPAGAERQLGCDLVRRRRLRGAGPRGAGPGYARALTLEALGRLDDAIIALEVLLSGSGPAAAPSRSARRRA